MTLQLIRKSSIALILVAVALYTQIGWSHSHAGQSSLFEQEEATISSSPFTIVIDGGSTGSRLHVFEFIENDDDESGLVCLRRGSSRADIPLSAFAPYNDTEQLQPRAVAEHLLPAFQYAATLVPAIYYNTTVVSYQATAGMRLLTEHQQEAVYDALFVGLMTSPEFVFKGMRRHDIQTLSGELEGLYGAVAANYLKGTINAKLEIIPGNKVSVEADDHHTAPLGALDMGGSSTQLVFLPSIIASASKTCEALSDEPECYSSDYDSETEVQKRLNGDDFFSTSYLSYGVDQFRERLWNTWIQEARARQCNDEDFCASNLIVNPCAFKGYQMEWNDFVFIGTGQADECVRQVQRLIPHPELPIDHHHSNDNVSNPTVLGKHVGGVEHPPIRGKFLAMSLYFFTLDSLRELTRKDTVAYEELNRSWPTPSIRELHNALHGLCQREWQTDLELIQDSAHAYTNPQVLPHRCLESVYLVTLLKDGFGFDPDSRDITFTFLVDDSEVEWSLGMALALRANATQDVDNEVIDVISSTIEHSKNNSCDENILNGDDVDDSTSTLFSFQRIYDIIFSMSSSQGQS